MEQLWYKGNYNLSLDEFPMVENEEGSRSNIVTSYSSFEDKDGKTKYVLYPTMHKGSRIDNPQEASKSMHFGEYDSLEGLQEADNRIHKFFEEEYTIRESLDRLMKNWLKEI